jgi:hypothetical protein
LKNQINLKRDILKAEKKENMQKMQAHKKIRGKANKINKITFMALAAGLILTVLGMKEIGNIIIWACMFVFVTTSLSGILAAGSLRKQR